MSSSTAITSVMRYQRGCGPSAGAPACRCRSAPARSTPRPWNAQRVSSAANAALPARSALRGARRSRSELGRPARRGAAQRRACARAAPRAWGCQGAAPQAGTAQLARITPRARRTCSHTQRQQKGAPAPAAWHSSKQRAAGQTHAAAQLKNAAAAWERAWRIPDPT